MVAADLETDPGGFWDHLDLDIADPAVFFANDPPVADGLDWDELVDLLKPICASCPARDLP
jgi:arginase family enzyme